MLNLRQAHGATPARRREEDFRPPEQLSGGSIGPRSTPSLVWRVFWVNASLLAAAATLLAVSPATVSFPVTARELLVLAAGLIVVLLTNAAMLRFSLRPLLDFERTMNRIVRLMPEEHLQPAGATELESITAAFNQILQRLEAERRATSRRLVGREEEARKRLASELSAEVGQRLTVLLLQLGSIIEEAPPELLPRLLTTQELARDTLEEITRLAQRLCPTNLEDRRPGQRAPLYCSIWQSGTRRLRYSARSSQSCPSARRRPNWRSTGSSRKRSPMSFATLRPKK